MTAAEPKTAVVLLAAGASTRMGVSKLMLSFCGRTPLERCAEALEKCSHRISETVIAVNDTTRNEAERLAEAYPGLCIRAVAGGDTRGDSVYNALKTLDCDVVVIHDAARCLVTADMVDASIDSAAENGSGIVCIPARDTIRRADGQTLDRSELYITQTPQTFLYERIRRAYDDAEKDGFAATDDCAVYTRLGYRPAFVDGDIMNQKLTFCEDVPFFRTAAGERDIRIGFGEDTHRLKRGRKLILGGVTVPYHMGLDGHSDADALIHAVIDALLGAAALGDIGRHFPDTDMSYKDISSVKLLVHAAGLLRKSGFVLGNADATIVCQQPKLAQYIDGMRSNIAGALGVSPSLISVKATTPEGLGPEGQLKSITVRCVCTVKRIPEDGK